MRTPPITVPIHANEFGAVVYGALRASLLAYVESTFEAAVAGGVELTPERMQQIALEALEKTLLHLADAHPFRDPLTSYIRNTVVPWLAEEKPEFTPRASRRLVQ